MHRLRIANLLSYMLFVFSLLLIVFVFIFTRNIQVLSNWNLTLPSGDIHVGDTIVVASTYVKLRQVDGSSVRSIECQSTKGIYISTPLNKAIANRAPGKTGTGIVATIPSKLSGITALPDACHICVSLTYPVLPLKTVSYFHCTKDFTLLPSAAPVAVSSAATQTSQSPVVFRGQAGSSSSDVIPIAISTQQSTLQPAPVQTQLGIAPQPSLLQSVNSVILQATVLIGRLLQ